MNDLIVHPRYARDPEAAGATVAKGFWSKVRATAGKVPFVEDAVAGYFCALDPASPARVRASLFGALAYFVTPVDLIPDFVAGLGYSDDAAVLYGVIRIVGAHIRRRHRLRAAAVLRRDPPPPEDARSE